MFSNDCIVFAKSVNFFIINIRYYTAEITKICNAAALLSVFSTLTRESLNLSPNLLHTQINEICENENTRIDTNFFFCKFNVLRGSCFNQKNKNGANSR